MRQVDVSEEIYQRLLGIAALSGDVSLNTVIQALFLRVDEMTLMRSREDVQWYSEKISNERQEYLSDCLYDAYLCGVTQGFFWVLHPSAGISFSLAISKSKTDDRKKEDEEEAKKQ